MYPTSVPGEFRLRSLNACRIPQKVSESNRVDDPIRCIRILIGYLNAVTKDRQGILHALQREARGLRTGYKISLLTDSPLLGMANWFDIALKLKNGGSFFCLLQADLQHLR